MLNTAIFKGKDREVGNCSYNSSPDAKFQKKNRDQWRKVLGTFDIIKEDALVNKTKPKRKCSIRKKKIIQQKQRRMTLSSSLTNTINNRNCSQDSLYDSMIVWSSSNEESDSCLGNATLNQETGILGNKDHLKDIHHETDINSSSSNEGENEENLPINKSVSRCKYLKRKNYDSEINWSSSNDSESEENQMRKSRLRTFPKKVNSECELDSFVREIEKDLRRTKTIKQKLSTKKGGYMDNFRKAVNKAKADTGFFDYEQRAEIICGCKGVITEKKVSYGAHLANVRLEAGSDFYIFLGKKMQTTNNGSAVVCFLENSHCYTVNDKNVYVQPNKVIRA